MNAFQIAAAAVGGWLFLSAAFVGAIWVIAQRRPDPYSTLERNHR